QDIVSKEVALYLDIPFGPHGINWLQMAKEQTQKAWGVIVTIAAIGMNATGWAPASSAKIYCSFIWPSMEYGVALKILFHKALKLYGDINLTGFHVMVCDLKKAVWESHLAGSCASLREFFVAKQMRSKIFCALSSGSDLTGFHVDFDVSLTVSDLKDAIYAKKMHTLGHLDADALTLVRIWKADVGGLTIRELKQSREFLGLTAYGNDPEDGDDVVSPLQTSPGVCLMKDGLTFKVCVIPRYLRGN
ncbi:hypothetical protein HDU83_009283, partial [Entophlyctis luteolus]